MSSQRNLVGFQSRWIYHLESIQCKEINLSRSYGLLFLQHRSIGFLTRGRPLVEKIFWISDNFVMHRDSTRLHGVHEMEGKGGRIQKNTRNTRGCLGEPHPLSARPTTNILIAQACGWELKVTTLLQPITYSFGKIDSNNIHVQCRVFFSKYEYRKVFTESVALDTSLQNLTLGRGTSYIGSHKVTRGKGKRCMGRTQICAHRHVRTVLVGMPEQPG